LFKQTDIERSCYDGVNKTHNRKYLSNNLSILKIYCIWLAFKCKKCNILFEEKNRLEIHKRDTIENRVSVYKDKN